MGILQIVFQQLFNTQTVGSACISAYYRHCNCSEEKNHYSRVAQYRRHHPIRNAIRLSPVATGNSPREHMASTGEVPTVAHRRRRQNHQVRGPRPQAVIAGAKFIVRRCKRVASHNSSCFSAPFPLPVAAVALYFSCLSNSRFPFAQVIVIFPAGLAWHKF